MIEVLKKAIAGLHYPLLNRGNWQTGFNEKTNTECLWSTMSIDGENYYVCLNKYVGNSCTNQACVIMLLGKCKMMIKIADEKIGPFLLQQFTTYEISDKIEWHDLQLIDKSTMAITVSKTEPKENQRTLTKTETDNILNYFQNTELRNKMLIALDDF